MKLRERQQNKQETSVPLKHKTTKPKKELPPTPPTTSRTPSPETFSDAELDLDSTIINLDNSLGLLNEQKIQKTIGAQIVEHTKNTMANPIPANITLKDALKVVPNFNGEDIPLGQFLEGLDEARSMIEDNHEATLVKLARSKINGEARKAIYGHDFTTIEALKTYLREIYFSNQSVFQLTGILGNTFQRHGENVISFANRVRELGSRIIEAYKYENQPTNAALETFRTETQNNLTACFKKGLLPDIEQRMTMVGNLGEIARRAIKIEKELSQMEKLRNGMTTLNFKEKEKRRIFNTSKMEWPNSDEENELESNARMNFMDPVIKCRLCFNRTHETRLCPLTLCKRCGERIAHPTYECPHEKEDITRGQIRCQICDGSHSAKNCGQRQQKGLYATMEQMSRKTEPEHDQGTVQQKSPKECQLCNGIGHLAPQCFKFFPPKSNFKERLQQSCSICGKTGHNYTTCNQVQKTCTYCGMNNHTVDYCFAKKRVERQGNEQGPSKMGAAKDRINNQPNQAMRDPTRFVTLN